MRSKKYSFEVVLEKEEKGGYHAYCPDLPGCHTWGRNLHHASKMVQEAILAYCEALQKMGKPIPRPRSSKVVMRNVHIALRAA